MQAGRLCLPSLYIVAESLDRHSQAPPGSEEVRDFPLILARRPLTPFPRREGEPGEGLGPDAPLPSRGRGIGGGRFKKSL